MSKSYRELLKLASFEERFEYLRIGGLIGEETFGFDRYLNQLLYKSPQWKQTRDRIIIRDNACDLAISDRQIYQRVIVHHINPITIEQVGMLDDSIFDEDNLICVSHETHNAIHYGDERQLILSPQERTKGDTCLWRVY